MSHKLEADGILLSYGSRKILKDIYIQCHTGKITGLLGRNGHGKTSLLNIISGNLKAQSRSVRFDDQSIFEAFKRPDLLTYLPQFNFVPSALTLSRIFKDFDVDFSLFTKEFSEFKEQANQKFGKLSGGQRRLAEVYLIIKSKSKFSLLDEPFSQLMPLHIGKIKTIISNERERKGFIITDHLYQEVVEMSDALYLLKEGKTHLITSALGLVSLGYVKF